MWDWLKRAVLKKVVRAGVGEKNLRAAEKNLRAAEAHVGAVNKPEQGALLHVASIAWPMMQVFIHVLAERALCVAEYLFDRDPPPAGHTAKGGCSASCLPCVAPLRASVTLLLSS